MKNKNILNTNIANKVVVITGAGGVLGTSFVKEFARQKTKVALLDINFESIKETSDLLNKQGFSTIPVECNVLDKNSIIAAMKKIKDNFGDNIDVLINGAGGNSKQATTKNEFFKKEDLEEKTDSFFNINMDAFKFTFDLNIIGTILVTQVLLKMMLKKGASIINIGSVSADASLTKIPAYSAAKSGVTNFSKWLANYLGKVGVRVNTIVPGFFLTHQNKNLLMSEDGSYTERAKKILNGTPFNRFGDPSELLGTLIFLSDDEASSFISGSEIVIDGGFTSYVGV